MNDILQKGICINCKQSPVIFRKHSGQHLCIECFIKSIEKLIYKTISTNKMLNQEDRILVAYSGGISSTTLIHNLQKIQKRKYGAYPIKAFTIFDKFEKDLTKITKSFCEINSIEHKLVSYSSLRALERNYKDLSLRYAFYNNSILEILAEFLDKMEVNVLCLGINLTDIAECCLLEIFNKFRTESKRKSKIKIITPLMRISENEIAIYSLIKNFELKYNLLKEPKFSSSLREFIRNSITLSPEIEYNLYQVYRILLRIGFIN